jgi:excisionase family DNA binding protein
MNTPMLTSKEAADLLRLSPQTIVDYVRRGKLPAVKVGRSWLLRREDVERLLESPPAPEQAPAG